jgi:serine/threonine protein kinase
MSLDPGTRLGPYEIRSPLGAGGMGEVYRARDTRLDRDVAIKVLPQHLSEHAEVRARFEREARTVSSLNHPNICTLFDVGREGDVDYLVMELVEGETLADKLSRGPLPLADVIRLGTQIADALDRAPRAGIVHRDLKPGNVMLTKGGAKLMDFGLARSAGLAGSSGGTGETLLTHSPTVGQPLTAEGTIVGTFQYMSPEQLEGKEADTRSDLWALGCVLYEMATGKRAFDGSTQASLISAIMRDTPRPLAELAPLSPPALEKLVVALLAKDPDERVQTAHDVKLQLQWMADATPSSALHAAVNAGAMPSRRRGAPWAWVVAALALVLAGAGGGMALSRDGGVVAPRTRLLIPDPENADLVNEG